MIMIRWIRLAPALVGCMLLAGVAASAQEVKTPALRGSIAGFAGALQEPKAPAFKAPELKAPAEKMPAIFGKPAPESVDDLKAIQDHVAKVVEKISPSVVSVRIGASFGSGVIVTKDGYVLTAGHVSGKPDRDVVVYFTNGKTAKGKTLGGNHGIDSGMIKITSEGDWPYAEMGDSKELKVGDWCMVCSHPGGFKPGRTPPVRLGRLLKASDTRLVTDCILVGGDSGGPIFDMHGRVVGINSSIGNAVTANNHVPVNPFRDHWDKIAKNEVWGTKQPAKTSLFIGVQTDPNAKECVLLSVTKGSPADKAGLKVNDVIRKFDNQELSGSVTLPKLIQARKAGDVVVLEVLRGEETLTSKVEIGKR
jgi:serine protease Do